VSARRRLAIQIVAMGLGLVPLATLCARALTGRLGANPIEEATHLTGSSALRLLLLALAVTPARRWLRWHWAAPLRRSFGLLAFGYASLHLGIYLVLDQSLDGAAILEDVAERPYVSAGLLAFLCLVPLAATSTRAMVQRLGRRWKPLHRLAYAAAGAAVVHHLWLVKADLREPLVHASLLAVLLAARLPRGLLGSARDPALGSRDS